MTSGGDLFNSPLVCCLMGVVISFGVENQPKTNQEPQLLLFFDNFVLFTYEVRVFFYGF